jgi:hypothetical protein
VPCCAWTTKLKVKLQILYKHRIQSRKLIIMNERDYEGTPCFKVRDKNYNSNSNIFLGLFDKNYGLLGSSCYDGSLTKRIVTEIETTKIHGLEVRKPFWLICKPIFAMPYKSMWGAN